MQLRARPAVVLCGTPMSANYADELAVARRAAEEAGRFALGHFKTRLTVEVKADGSPVTIADRGAEERLRHVLGAAFPGDGFLGEELGETSGTSARRWIIDPIDGTQSFIRGVPLYGVLLGTRGPRSGCVVGAAGFPALGETYWAGQGAGAFLNGAPIRVSAVTSLADATLAHQRRQARVTTTPSTRLYERLLRALRAAARMGRLLWLRARRDRRRRGHGRSKVSLWDIAALTRILNEAAARSSTGAAHVASTAARGRRRRARCASRCSPRSAQVAEKGPSASLLGRSLVRHSSAMPPRSLPRA